MAGVANSRKRLKTSLCGSSSAINVRSQNQATEATKTKLASKKVPQ